MTCAVFLLELVNWRFGYRYSSAHLCQIQKTYTASHSSKLLLLKLIVVNVERKERWTGQEAMKIVCSIFIIIFPLSSSFPTIFQPPKVHVSLGFNGLEYDESEMNEFVDKLTMHMDSLGINDDFVRREYSQWLIRHNKLESEGRYKQFKKNLLKQLEFDSETGDFFRLNELGDRTQGTSIRKHRLSSSQFQRSADLYFFPICICR